MLKMEMLTNNLSISCIAFTQYLATSGLKNERRFLVQWKNKYCTKPLNVNDVVFNSGTV
jgi:hypothetical protein